MQTTSGHRCQITQLIASDCITLNCIFFFLLKIASCKFFLTGPRGVPVAMIWEHQLCSNSLLLCSFSFSFCVLHISSINSSIFLLSVFSHIISRPSRVSCCFPFVNFHVVLYSPSLFLWCFLTPLTLRVSPYELSSIIPFYNSFLHLPLHLKLSLFLLSTPCTPRLSTAVMPLLATMPIFRVVAPFPLIYPNRAIVSPHSLLRACAQPVVLTSSSLRPAPLARFPIQARPRHASLPIPHPTPHSP